MRELSVKEMKTQLVVKHSNVMCVVKSLSEEF